MKAIIIITFMALVLASTSFAEGKKSKHRFDRFDKMDSDKDGKISMDEWIKSQRLKFKKMDKNKDGFLTKEERKSHRGKKKKHKKNK